MPGRKRLIPALKNQPKPPAMPSDSAPAADPDARRLAARLKRAERLLRLNELLVAGLVHDLRTPLMAINLSAEVALARSQEDAVQQAARRIRTSSERMARTFDHLLNLSRVGAETADPDLRPGDLHATAAAVFAEVRAAKPGAAFEITREGELGGVFDAAMLREVIANVVATVLPYAGKDAPIAVRFDGSHRDRLWLRISVPGVIPADVQERMFVPGPNVPGLEASGLGLGLHPVDGYVRAHGGSVVGRSRAPAGTVFEMLLPRNALGLA